MQQPTLTALFDRQQKHGGKPPKAQEINMAIEPCKDWYPSHLFCLFCFLHVLIIVLNIFPSAGIKFEM